MPVKAVFTLQLGVFDPRLVERTILDVGGMSAWARTAPRGEVFALFPRMWGLSDNLRSDGWSARAATPAARGESLRRMLEGISYTPTFHLSVERAQGDWVALGARMRLTDTAGVTATPVKRLAEMVTEYLADAPPEVQEAGYARFPMTRHGTVRVPRSGEINISRGRPIAPLRAEVISPAIDGYPTPTGQGLSSYPYLALSNYQGAHVSSLITKTVTAV